MSRFVNDFVDNEDLLDERTRFPAELQGLKVSFKTGGT